MITLTKFKSKYNTFVCCYRNKYNSRQTKCIHFAKLRQFIKITYSQISLTKLIKTLITKKDSIKCIYNLLEAAYLKIDQSITKLIQELPIISSIKRPIIVKIYKTVKLKNAMTILNLNKFTNRKAKKESDNSILMMKSKSNITRKKINLVNIDKI